MLLQLFQALMPICFEACLFAEKCSDGTVVGTDCSIPGGATFGTCPTLSTANAKCLPGGTVTFYLYNCLFAQVYLLMSFFAVQTNVD